MKGVSASIVVLAGAVMLAGAGQYRGATGLAVFFAGAAVTLAGMAGWLAATFRERVRRPEGPT